jgi:hypothetical protein
MIVGLPAHASYGLPSAANFRIAGDTSAIQESSFQRIENLSMSELAIIRSLSDFSKSEE